MYFFFRIFICLLYRGFLEVNDGYRIKKNKINVEVF